MTSTSKRILILTAITLTGFIPGRLAVRALMNLLLVILLFILSRKPFVPSSYTKTGETGGELEAKYLALGQYEVTLAYVLEQNDAPNSAFYQKVDTAHIGITAHSQSGVGVFNAAFGSRCQRCDHGKMLYCADGYVTAWFLWYLQGNEETAKVLLGDSAKLLRNPLYINQSALTAE